MRYRDGTGREFLYRPEGGRGEMMYQVIKSTRSLAASKGKWVARAIHPQIIDTRRIANEMETGSTLKRSDVRAVICELGEAMVGHLRDGHIVDLIYIFSNFSTFFRIGVINNVSNIISKVFIIHQFRVLTYIFSNFSTFFIIGVINNVSNII